MFTATRKNAKAPFHLYCGLLNTVYVPVCLYNYTTYIWAEQLLNLHVATSKNSETTQCIREDRQEIQAHGTMTAFGGWGDGNFPTHHLLSYVF